MRSAALRKVEEQPGSLVTLRAYQEHSVASVLRAYQKAFGRSGSKRELPLKEVRKLPFCRPLAVLPTGSGKSVCFLELALRVLRERGWKTLVVVPSRRLVKQIVEAAEKYYPGLRAQSFKRARRRIDRYDLVVTTAAGMGSKWRSALGRDYFKLVVYDEAHHLPARTYRDIFTFFSGAEIAVGFTATPTRGDSESVADSEEFFTHIVSYYSISQLTYEGYLSPVHGVFVDTKVSLADVSVARGDYNEAELSRVVNTEGLNKLVVDKWKEYSCFESGGLRRPALVFAVDVQHARDLADFFRREGVSAKAVWGDMEDEELEAAVEEFLRGEVDVLVNVRLFTEGVDLKKVSLIINARPMTPESLRVLGAQIVGRGTRLSPETGKFDCYYVEFLYSDGAATRTAAGRKGRGKVAGRGSAPVPKSALHAAYGIADFEVTPGVPVHLQARVYEEKRTWYEKQKKIAEAKEGTDDLFFNIAERIARANYFSWMPLGTKSKFMMLGGGDYVELLEHDYYKHEVRIVYGGDLVVRSECGERREASAIANKWLREKFGDGVPGEVPGGSASHAWREGEPSPLHVGQAHAMTGLPFEYLEKMTLGQVCDLITTVRALEAEPVEEELLKGGGVWRDVPVQRALSFV